MMSEIEACERDIAAQHRIPYDRVDRLWLRGKALERLANRRGLLVVSDAIDEVFAAARATIAKLEAERDERVAWESGWRPSDREATP